MRCFATAASLALVVTAMFAPGPVKAQTPMTSENACWLNTNGANYHWGDCLTGVRRIALSPRAVSTFARAGGPGITGESGCWLNTNGTRYHWGYCLGR